MEILKNHEDMPETTTKVLKNMIPLVMCQLNGEIDITMTDFDEVKDHPLAEPL